MHSESGESVDVGKPGIEIMLRAASSSRPEVIKRKQRQFGATQPSWLMKLQLHHHYN